MGLNVTQPNEVPDHSRRRRIAGMAGLEASADLGPVDWQLQLLSDVTGVHRGEELRFALGHDRYIDQHRISLAGGLSWKSADLLEYYYGVRANEATAHTPTYQPGSGISPFVRMSWSRAVSENWRWQGSFQYDYLSRAVRHSPLIEDNQVVQVFIGGVYHFCIGSHSNNNRHIHVSPSLHTADFHRRVHRGSGRNAGAGDQAAGVRAGQTRKRLQGTAAHSMARRQAHAPVFICG